jgi:hypothetical protein
VLRADSVRESVEREGVIKFRLHHERRALHAHRYEEPSQVLDRHRAALLRVGAVGRDPRRYEGAGFGNVSLRIGPLAAPVGARPMLISGSQTGGQETLGLSHVCVVDRYDDARNEVWSHGPVEPSSEAMTHAALYDLDPTIRFVVHGHCPTLWRRAPELGVPCTEADVPYGTAAMAAEVRRLYRDTRLAVLGILAMRGHEDGVVAFGHRPAEVTSTLLRYLERADALERRESLPPHGLGAMGKRCGSC